MQKKIQLSVIVTIVKKDKKYLKNCLFALEKSANCASCSLEIIIVANGTKPSKLNFLKSKYKTTFNNRNLGFGQAINKGMKMAKSKWCIILAPDTRASKLTIHHLLKHIHKKNVAIVGPKILFTDNLLDYSILPLTSLYTIFLEQSFLYKIFPKLFRHPFGDKSLYNTTKEVKGLASTFWLINKNIFWKTGGFDPRFFLFHDDTDLCKRIYEKHYKIIFEPKAKILHLGHKSTGGIMNAKYHIESYYIYLEKYYNPVYIKICFLLLLLGCLLRAIYWKCLYPKNYQKIQYNKYQYLTRAINTILTKD